MSAMDYGALCWRDGKQLGARKDLFESTMDTLGFEITPFDYSTSDYIRNQYETDHVEHESATYDSSDYLYIGNKDIIISFYKGLITVCDYANKKVTHVNCYENEFRTVNYNIYGCKFSVKAIVKFGVYKFSMLLDDHKYTVIFGYGIDPEWYKWSIPECYEYNQKLVNLLNRLDDKHYKLDKRKCKNHMHKFRRNSRGRILSYAIDPDTVVGIQNALSGICNCTDDTKY